MASPLHETKTFNVSIATEYDRLLAVLSVLLVRIGDYVFAVRWVAEVVDNLLPHATNFGFGKIFDVHSGE
jgi:hypothetical protein